MLAAVEWHFVVSPDATPPAQLGFDRWPEESTKKMPDRTKCRRKRVLEHFEAAMAEKNEQLEREHQPKLVKDELVGAQLYTGPVFEKYNAVLRGLQSESPFLRNK